MMTQETEEEKAKKLEEKLEYIKEKLEAGNATRIRNGRLEVYVGQTGLGSMWLDVLTGEWN